MNLDCAVETLNGRGTQGSLQPPIVDDGTQHLLELQEGEEGQLLSNLLQKILHRKHYILSHKYFRVASHQLKVYIRRKICRCHLVEYNPE